MSTFRSCRDCVVEGMSTQHCTRCCMSFRSTYVGDYHDFGNYDNPRFPRRCRTPDEMRAGGFVQDEFGRWKGAPMPAEALARRQGAATTHPPRESEPLSALAGNSGPPEGDRGLNLAGDTTDRQAS